jgi:hypothetical protein
MVESAITSPGVSAGVGTTLDTLRDNRAGRATGLTTVTPLPRFWSPILKLVLRFKTWRGPDRTLRRLSFIHMAYWVIVDRFPDDERRRRYAYLMFVSNFNGSWFDYIDVFSAAVPEKMALLWGSSFGFPGAEPPRPFTNYIRAEDQALAHYYSAYPGATTTEIASALRVSEHVGPWRRHLTGGDDGRLADAWRALLGTVQRDL